MEGRKGVQGQTGRRVKGKGGMNAYLDFIDVYPALLLAKVGSTRPERACPT